MIDFDATSLNPSAMRVKKSLYLKIQSGFAFKPHMNDNYVETLITPIFNQDGNESAILNVKSKMHLSLYINIFL